MLSSQNGLKYRHTYFDSNENISLGYTESGDVQIICINFYSRRSNLILSASVFWRKTELRSKIMLGLGNFLFYFWRCNRIFTSQQPLVITKFFSTMRIKPSTHTALSFFKFLLNICIVQKMEFYKTIQLQWKIENGTAFSLTIKTYKSQISVRYK